MEIHQIVTAVIEGEKDPLESYILLKSLKDEIEEGLELIKDQAMSEAEKYGKSFDRFGAHIELRNAPGRFNFSEINLITQAENRLKYLKKLAEIGGVDEETAEVIPKAPKIHGKATIAIKLHETTK